MTSSTAEKEMNRLTANFQFAMSKALASEDKDDWITHLKAMSNAFTQACTAVISEESAKNQAIEERDETIRQFVKLQTKADVHNDLLKQIHVLLAGKNRHSNDLPSQRLYESLVKDTRGELEAAHSIKMSEARYKVEKWRNARMLKHINELSKQNVMHLMATRFYARELAATRQMMDLVRNSATIETALKSKLWDEIEKENRLLRLNTLWLINRINSPDLRGAPFEMDDICSSPPRLVILMRKHHNQGLGLEITGGCDQFRPVLVTNKLRRSMADDDQLKINDRILAIDGNFVTNTTTHEEVMKMLDNESAKDFIALIVSQFDPTNSCVSPRTNSTDHSTQSSSSSTD